MEVGLFMLFASSGGLPVDLFSKRPKLHPSYTLHLKAGSLASSNPASVLMAGVPSARFPTSTGAGRQKSDRVPQRQGS